MNPDEKPADAQINECFAQLPKVVQDAITSADVEKHLRSLAETHKLHLDQWQLLENEVMFTLLGFQDPEDLQGNLKTEVGIDDATAAALASDISAEVFEPIRRELERQLEHPEAKEEELTGAEAARKEIIAQESAAAEPAPEQQAVRSAISDSYRAGEASSARKDVHNDPYRESPV